MTGRPMLGDRLVGLVHVMGDGRVGHAEADPLHGHLEPLAVLRRGDRLGVGTDQLDLVLVEDAGLDQLHRQVQGGLPAEGGQHRVRTLPLDDPGQDLEVERLDVGGVGEVGVGHDRGRVRVGQDQPVALVAQHPTGLGARVVELAGLADDDRAGPDQQDGLDVVAAGHYCWSMRSAKRSNRYAASWGPGAASGWYWTLKAGTSRLARPSITPSLRFTWVTSAACSEPSATA